MPHLPVDAFEDSLMQMFKLQRAIAGRPAEAARALQALRDRVAADAAALAETARARAGATAKPSEGE